MRIHTLHREQEIDAPREAVFAFFADPFNLEVITPPLLRFAVVTGPTGSGTTPTSSRRSTAGAR